MIAKAKHHWCNSRIDKRCSLRLIQRRVVGELGLAITTLIETLWVCKCRFGAATGHPWLCVWWGGGWGGGGGVGWWWWWGGVGSWDPEAPQKLLKSH